MSRAEYIRFTELPRPGRKTKLWDVIENTEGPAAFVLGNIRWYSAWRCYAFYPEKNTVFETVCLAQISKFCGDRTNEHRFGKANETT